MLPAHRGGRVAQLVERINENPDVVDPILPHRPSIRLTMRANSKTIGDYAELLVAAKFASMGHYVSRPLTDNAPYDLILDIDGDLKKVQVKSRSKRQGVVKVELVSTNDRYLRPYTLHDFDILVVHCIEDDRLAYLGWDCLRDVKNNLSLRIDDTKNRMSSGIRWFRDYENFPPHMPEVDLAIVPSCVGSSSQTIIITDR